MFITKQVGGRIILMQKLGYPPAEPVMTEYIESQYGLERKVS